LGDDVSSQNEIVVASRIGENAEKDAFFDKEGPGTLLFFRLVASERLIVAFGVGVICGGGPMLLAAVLEPRAIRRTGDWSSPERFFSHSGAR
jgi:hypothetical protein